MSFRSRVAQILTIVAFLSFMAGVITYVPTPFVDVEAQTVVRAPIANDVQVSCTSNVAISVNSATTTQLVALDANKSIFVCAFHVNSIGAATAPTAKFVYGSGASCGTGTTNLTGVMSGSATAGVPYDIFQGNGLGSILAVPKGKALCITTTTTQQQSGFVSYAQF